MKGFVRNLMPVYAHAMKRSIGPNQTITLDELYNQYGKKHNLNKGAEFVSWLKGVKLKDRDRWQIVFEEDTEETSSTSDVVIEEKVVTTNKIDKQNDVSNFKARDLVTPIVPTKSTVADIVKLSVRQAREMVPKINDLNLLKYALQEANQLANKDSLCIVLRKRIKDIASYR